MSVCRSAYLNWIGRRAAETAKQMQKQRMQADLRFTAKLVPSQPANTDEESSGDETSALEIELRRVLDEHLVRLADLFVDTEITITSRCFRCNTTGLTHCYHASIRSEKLHATLSKTPATRSITKYVQLCVCVCVCCCIPQKLACALRSKPRTGHCHRMCSNCAAEVHT